MSDARVWVDEEKDRYVAGAGVGLEGEVPVIRVAAVGLGWLG